MSEEKKSNIEMAYAVLISIGDGKSTGSGFRILVDETLYLVTARHVIYGPDGRYGDRLLATSYAPGDFDLDAMILNIDLNAVDVAAVDSFDVVAIPIGKQRARKNQKEKPSIKVHEAVEAVQWGVARGSNLRPKSTKKLNQLTAGSTVFLVGYPTSLGMLRNDYYDFTRPLLRKGSIAGIDKKKSSFVIDCASYPGNSGGLVFERAADGKFYAVGMVSSYIPFETKWYSNREKIYNTEVTNSGYTVCIAMDVVLDLIARMAQPASQGEVGD